MVFEQQFIQKKERTNELVVKEESLRQLLGPVTTLNGNELQETKTMDVAVLCIMGPSRSGKSFYLNFVRLYLDNLESGNRG